MVRFFLRLNEEDEEEKFPKAAEGCRTPNLECGTPVQLLDIFFKPRQQNYRAKHPPFSSVYSAQTSRFFNIEHRCSHI
jgi:hypothetical protein